jgi:hypothetical protein
MRMGPIQKTLYGDDNFQKSPHMFNSVSRNSSYAQKSVFLGEGPSLGPNSGLLGQGSKNPVRTIETHLATDLCYVYVKIQNV